MNIYVVMDHPPNSSTAYSYFKLEKSRRGYYHWRYCDELYTGRYIPEKPDGTIINKRLPFDNVRYVQFKESDLDDGHICDNG